MSQEEYKNLLEQTKKWYKTLKKCFCGALKKDIVFNSKGFYHLLYDGKGHGRTNKERIERLKVLVYVPEVLKECLHISVKKYGDIYYWKLQGVVGIEKIPITIILRKIGNGQIMFYSVWKNWSRND